MSPISPFPGLGARLTTLVLLGAALVAGSMRSGDAHGPGPANDQIVRAGGESTPEQPAPPHDERSCAVCQILQVFPLGIPAPALALQGTVAVEDEWTGSSAVSRPSTRASPARAPPSR